MNKAQAVLVLDSILESSRSDTHKNNLLIIPEIPGFNATQLAAFEYEYLGFYLTNNPLNEYRRRLSQVYSYIRLKDPDVVNRSRVVIAGRATNYRQLLTKAKREEMAIFNLEDLTGKTEVVVFNRTYVKYKDILHDNALLEIEGEAEVHESEPDDEGKITKIVKIKAQKIKTLEETKKISKVILNIDNTDLERAEQLREILDRHSGNIPVELCIDNRFRTKLPNGIAWDSVSGLEMYATVQREFE